MAYRVLLVDGYPSVIDAAGNDVPDALVVGMHMPSGTMSGPNGNVSYIKGPLTADIVVAGARIDGVPLSGKP